MEVLIFDRKHAEKTDTLEQRKYQLGKNRNFSAVTKCEHNLLLYVLLYNLVSLVVVQH
jgi:hypothetical protein